MSVGFETEALAREAAEATVGCILRRSSSIALARYS